MLLSRSFEPGIFYAMGGAHVTEMLTSGDQMRISGCSVLEGRASTLGSLVIRSSDRLRSVCPDGYRQSGLTEMVRYQPQEGRLRDKVISLLLLFLLLIAFGQFSHRNVRTRRLISTHLERARRAFWFKLNGLADRAPWILGVQPRSIVAGRPWSYLLRSMSSGIFNELVDIKRANRFKR